MSESLEKAVEETDTTKVVQPRWTRITGETIDHEHIDVTGWIHSVVSRRDVSADYLEWVEGATRHVDRMTFVVDISINGERQEIELLNYTAYLQDESSYRKDAAAALRAALPHLSADDLRDTPAGRALVAQGKSLGWDDAIGELRKGQGLHRALAGTLSTRKPSYEEAT